IPRDTATWLGAVGEQLQDKLAAMGLVEQERRLTAGEFLADWLAGKRRSGFKPASLIAWGQTVKELTAISGGKTLVTIPHTDGEASRAAMQQRGCVPARGAAGSGNESHGVEGTTRERRRGGVRRHPVRGYFANGGAGNRTRVPKHFRTDIYVCSLS